MHDGELTMVEKIVQRGAGRVEALGIAEWEDGSGGQAEVRAEAVVGIVGKGYDGVEAVVAASELDEHEDGAVFFGARGFGAHGLHEERGGELTEREQADAAGSAAQKFATGGGKG